MIKLIDQPIIQQDLPINKMDHFDIAEIVDASNRGDVGLIIMRTDCGSSSSDFQAIVLNSATPE